MNDTFTADDYHRRIERAFAACEWGNTNPYRAQIAERLASMGGLHCPSRAADRFTEREQPRVDHARETAEAKAEPATPF
ncbi:hypothetical protein Pla108_40860 [Botrimarina colliarenosi]|uniref:Uncharacterized protein n=1 Tax=Botrimarina colliarenosi TaxID=2528001 RepID=A0A5C5ZZG1_9BACT|nr:hypothetical protein [Botrimarina colliarenosi]TWT92460.1 hypothetical protein Pla108_40860 [Botrimarina colliarenosi]